MANKTSPKGRRKTAKQSTNEERFTAFLKIADAFRVLGKLVLVIRDWWL